MRVLLISPRVSGVSGTAQHVRKLAQLLRRDGHEVDVVSCENTPIVPVKNLMNPSFMISSTLKVVFSRLLGARYDVVHAHNVPSALAMRVARGGRMLTLHGIYSEQLGYLHGALYGRLGSALEQAALEWADVVTVVSRQAAEYYAKLGYRVVHVPNAVDLSELPGEGLRLYEPQVVYTGRLSREKGVDILVRGFRESDLDAHLVVVGGGPLRRELEELARGDPRIHLLGPKPRAEALKIVRGSDVFVLPSRHEGISTSLLEAMAMGVPVVATAVGGNLELVEDGRTGLLVRPEDPGELVRAIASLLNDRGLAARLAEEARREVARSYSWRVVYRRYLSVYESLAP
ncbi:MAG: glycosyltransferase family 1 protein [Thermoprotei archaeon]|nr:MAG: glycosyltransferase family 1 protein [Thermoprotei archaeon]